MAARKGTMGGRPVEEVSAPVLNVEAEAEVKAEVEAEVEDDLEDEDESLEIDPSEELWEGGPVWADILAWKAQHGEESVYVTSLSPTKHVVWRTITRAEYRSLVRSLEQAVATGEVSQAEATMNNEEQVAELCILYPKYTRAQLSGEMAGVATIISQEVMEASAFVAMDVRQL